MSASYRLVGERNLRKYTEDRQSPVYAAESEVKFISTHLCDVPWESANGVRDARMTWHTNENVGTEDSPVSGLDQNVVIRDQFDAALFCAGHVGGSHRAYANAACYRYELPAGAIGKTLESLTAAVTSDPYNAVGARIALLTNSTGDIPADCGLCRNGGRLVNGEYVQDESYHTPDGGVAKRRSEGTGSSATWYPVTEDVTLSPEGFVLQKYLFVFVLLENYDFSRGNWIEGSSFIENRISVTLSGAVTGWAEGGTVDLRPEPESEKVSGDGSFSAMGTGSECVVCETSLSGYKLPQREVVSTEVPGTKLKIRNREGEAVTEMDSTTSSAIFAYSPPFAVRGEHLVRGGQLSMLGQFVIIYEPGSSSPGSYSIPGFRMFGWAEPDGGISYTAQFMTNGVIATNYMLGSEESLPAGMDSSPAYRMLADGTATGIHIGADCFCLDHSTLGTWRYSSPGYVEDTPPTYGVDVDGFLPIFVSGPAGTFILGCLKFSCAYKIHARSVAAFPESSLESWVTKGYDFLAMSAAYANMHFASSNAVAIAPKGTMYWNEGDPAAYVSYLDNEGMHVDSDGRVTMSTAIADKLASGIWSVSASVSSDGVTVHVSATDSRVEIPGENLRFAVQYGSFPFGVTNSGGRGVPVPPSEAGYTSFTALSLTAPDYVGGSFDTGTTPAIAVSGIDDGRVIVKTVNYAGQVADKSESFAGLRLLGGTFVRCYSMYGSGSARRFEVTTGLGSASARMTSYDFAQDVLFVGDFTSATYGGSAIDCPDGVLRIENGVASVPFSGYRGYSASSVLPYFGRYVVSFSPEFDSVTVYTSTPLDGYLEEDSAESSVLGLNNCYGDVVSGTHGRKVSAGTLVGACFTVSRTSDSVVVRDESSEGTSRTLEIPKWDIVASEFFVPFARTAPGPSSAARISWDAFQCSVPGKLNVWLVRGRRVTEFEDAFHDKDLFSGRPSDVAELLGSVDVDGSAGSAVLPAIVANGEEGTLVFTAWVPKESVDVDSMTDGVAVGVGSLVVSGDSVVGTSGLIPKVELV